MAVNEPADEYWGPSRPERSHRRTGRGGLTQEQQALADDLHVKALAMRAASDGELSIREAVELAAHQLGLESPQTHIDEAGE